MHRTQAEIRAYNEGYRDGEGRSVINDKNENGHVWENYLNRRAIEKYLRDMGVQP